VSNKPNFAAVFLSFSSDSFDEQMFSAYLEYMMKQVDTADTDDDEKETEDATEDGVKDMFVKECKFCKSTSCLLPDVYDETIFLAEGMEENEVPNKEIRYAIYCFVAKKLWGRLGRNVRQHIPHCIMSEIHWQGNCLLWLQGR
jgi:hypothetical protein